MTQIAVMERSYDATIADIANREDNYCSGTDGTLLGADLRWIVTWGGAKSQSEAAVATGLISGCVKDVMADPEAVAELKVKRTVDYDDVVRDFRKKDRRHDQSRVSVQ